MSLTVESGRPEVVREFSNGLVLHRCQLWHSQHNLAEASFTLTT